MGDEHRISFLDGVKVTEAPQKTAEKSAMTMQQLAEKQKAKKLNNKDNGLMSSAHISSARTGEIGNQGGPSKYIKSETSNTMWDSDKTSKMAEGSQERVAKEKEVIATNRRDAEQKRMDTLVDSLRGTDQTKAAAVSPAGTFSGTNYKTQSNNMSIFDTKDFERLQDKTAGEQVTEDNASRRGKKDDSWRDNAKSITSKELVSDFFNQLMDKKVK